MSRYQRWLLKTARTIHVYATLFGLALILFFAVTGFILNHVEWFESDHIYTVTQSLPTAKLPGGKLPEPDAKGEATGEDKLAVVEALRKEFGLTGELTSFDFVERSDDDGNAKKLIKVEFKRAGEIAEASIDRENATTALEYKSQGWAGVVSDLHRGNRGNRTNEVKFTGRVWSLVIDGTCILMLVISMTGLILWWSLKSRGKWGAIFLLTGGLGAFAVYYWFVP